MQFMFVVLLIILTLGVILYQDMAFRKISVILFPVFFLLSLISALRTQNLDAVLLGILIDSLYLIVLMLVSYAYFHFRHGVNKLTGIVGMGDLLFLFCATPLFDITQFIFFTSIGFLVSLIIHLLLRNLSSLYRACPTVPLAGYLSLCLGIRILIGVAVKI